MIWRGLGWLAVWLLSVLAAFMGGITVLAFTTPNFLNQYGFAPVDLALTVAFALPAILLWRRLRAR